MTFTTTIVKDSSNNSIDINTTTTSNNIKSDNNSNNSNVIALKGSIDIVTDFFFTAINSILYQRGIYLPETFKRECKYGITVLTTTDPTLLSYLQQIQEQITVWLLQQQVQKLVLVIKGIDTLETLERWQFNITVTNNDSINKSNNHNMKASNIEANTENMTPNHQSNVTSKTKDSSSNTLTKTTTKDLGGKSLKEIHTEIQAIIRQITASVTFLPLLQEPCTFDLLVYTNKDITLSTSSSSDNDQKWVDSDPCYIASNNVAQVKLRSFTTSIHTIDSMVSYKDATNDEWDI